MSVDIYSFIPDLVLAHWNHLIDASIKYVKEYSFVRGQKIGPFNIPLLREEFIISLDIWLKEIASFWKNVVHFSQGDKNQRIPALFTHNNVLYIQMQNLVCNSAFKTNRLIMIEISQEKVGTKVRRCMLS